MVGLLGQEVREVPLSEVLAKSPKSVDPEVIRVARAIGLG
jgi:hypothetical protein